MSSLPVSEEPWLVFEYEANMFFTLCKLLVPENREFASLSEYIRNSVVESTLLHTRQLAEILLSRGSREDDIKLSTLLPDYQSTRIDELKEIYGTDREKDSPCWKLNKMLAHPTTYRSSCYDYSSVLVELFPVIAEIIWDIQNHYPNHGQTLSGEGNNGTM